ncbi:dr1-associated corepressor homolog [Copidosoma floridanum]|uniref:dr1-associated corepressor homolog n=1 Tax=Copidosoma floridanum TaxID=29053 RepID=UPI0006C96271|nr:dr1-associated corepressor homolog [Copidosoma floridanum]
MPCSTTFDFFRATEMLFKSLFFTLVIIPLVLNTKGQQQESEPENKDKDEDQKLSYLLKSNNLRSYGYLGNTLKKVWNYTFPQLLPLKSTGLDNTRENNLENQTAVSVDTKIIHPNVLRLESTPTESTKDEDRSKYTTLKSNGTKSSNHGIFRALGEWLWKNKYFKKPQHSSVQKNTTSGNSNGLKNSTEVSVNGINNTKNVEQSTVGPSPTISNPVNTSESQNSIQESNVNHKNSTEVSVNGINNTKNVEQSTVGPSPTISNPVNTSESQNSIQESNVNHKNSTGVSENAMNSANGSPNTKKPKENEKNPSRLDEVTSTEKETSYDAAFDEILNRFNKTKPLQKSSENKV